MSRLKKNITNAIRPSLLGVYSILFAMVLSSILINGMLFMVAS